MKINKKNKKWIWAGIIILAFILVWGLIGSSQAAEVGITCDFGIGKDGSALCWKWHKNVVGEIGDAFNELLGK